MTRLEEIRIEIEKLKKEAEARTYINYLEKLESEDGKGIFRPRDGCKFEFYLTNSMFHEVRKLLVELYKMEIGE